MISGLPWIMQSVFLEDDALSGVVRNSLVAALFYGSGRNPGGLWKRFGSGKEYCE